MKEKFKYVIISVVLLLPFIYSFFYLKSYWNPYGEGNIDNLPVAVVNADKGDKGEKLVSSIKNAKKLKLNVVSKEKANDGLYDGKYYAIINIPESFTSDIKSASNKDKYHATITYSPNEKSNYLAHQIINNVVTNVEKNLDNEVNSAIVDGLSKNIEEVPSKLDTISSGFATLKDGTGKLSSGSGDLKNGTSELEYNYKKFNAGVASVKDGTDTLSNGINSLDNGISQLESANSSIDELVSGINDLKAGSDMFTQSLNDYTNGVNLVLTNTKPQIENLKNQACAAASAGMDDYKQQCSSLTMLLDTYDKLLSSSPKLVYGNQAINGGITKIKENENNFRVLQNGITTLKEGSSKLKLGAQTLSGGSASLYNSSIQIDSALGKLNSGATTLNSGLITLDNSVKDAKDELDNNINNTKQDVKKVESLSEYSKSPIKVKTKEVNKVNSYGTAFSPFFMSIGLWVGCLMMLIVFYYDKKERFGILGQNTNKKVKQILCYHGLISISSIVLGLLLQLLLDIQITSIPLYYISLLLIGNAFMGIIEFLIMTFNDIGKFIGLILLVLQLAAAGGTFPIETVTKGFRWMHSMLPMTYSVRLLREMLIKIEGNILMSNMIIITIIGIFFITLNLILAYNKEKKLKK